MSAIAHSLKSAAGNLGQMEMHDVCLAIETEAGAGDVERVRARVAELGALAVEVTNGAQAWIARHDAEATG